MITSYTQLVAAVQDYSLRSDAPIDLLIGLLEYDIAPLLVHYRAETNSTITVPPVTKTIKIPADLIKTRAIFVDGKPAKPISIFSDTIYPNEVTYFQTGNQIVFNSTSEMLKANLVYYGRIPALTSTATTNWLLEFYPNIYLFGVLAKLYHWARDDEGQASAQAQLSQALQQLDLDQRQYIAVTNPIAQEVTEW